MYPVCTAGILPALDGILIIWSYKAHAYNEGRMFLHASDLKNTKRRSGQSSRDELGRPQPTEEVDGDEVVSEWSYEPSNPPKSWRRNPSHRQQLASSPHAF